MHFKPRKMTPDEFLYPETGVRPRAESDFHRKLTADVIDRLSARYADRPDVYVSGNLLVYYIENNPYQVFAPGCFVAFGVPPGDRETYKGWEEGKLPSVLFDFTTSTNWDCDNDWKSDIYRDDWPVEEYFQFDPGTGPGRRLDPPLRGFRRTRGKLAPIKPDDGRVVSRVLGITLEAEGKRLVMSDSETGQPLELPHEVVIRRLTEQVTVLEQELAALKKRKS